MSEVVYRSDVRVDPVKGPIRRASLPGETEQVTFGSTAPSPRTLYKVPPDAYPAHATTLDYIIASTAGGMMGTFCSELEARKIPAVGDRLVAETIGDRDRR